MAGYPEIMWDGRILPCVERFVDIICYIADLVGVDHVGIGSDLPAEAGAHDRQEAWDIGKDIREKTAQTPMARLTAIVMKLDGGSKRSISEVSTVWQTSPTLRSICLDEVFPMKRSERSWD